MDAPRSKNVSLSIKLSSFKSLLDSPIMIQCALANRLKQTVLKKWTLKGLLEIKADLLLLSTDNGMGLCGVRKQPAGSINICAKS